MDTLFFEGILIKFLFVDEKVRNKVLPFLSKIFFDKIENKSIIKRILLFIKEYNRFPSVKEFKTEIYTDTLLNESFDETMNLDVSEYKDDFLLSNIEHFFRNKLIFNNVTELVEQLKENDKDLDKLNSFPDKFRKAVAFGFDDKIGLDVFSKEGKEKMFNHLHTKDSVISSGLKSFDRLIDGGFHRKSVNVIISESNKGKSLVKCSLACNFILQNYKTLYLTFELSEEYITNRILFNVFDVSKEELYSLSKEKFDHKYDESTKKLEHLLIVKKYSAGIVNVNNLRTLLEELKNKKSFVPDIICLDYLGLFNAANCSKNANSNEKGIIKCQELEGLASDYDLPIVTSAQANRSGYGKSKLDPSNIADAIGIFTETDTVFGLTQSDEQANMDPQLYTWDLWKNRYGENKKRITVGVNKGKMRVFDVDQSINKESKDEKEVVNDIKVNLNKTKKDKRSKVILFD